MNRPPQGRDRGAGQLIFELLLAFLIAWAAVAANGFVASACETQLPAVEVDSRNPDTGMEHQRSCQ